MARTRQPDACAQQSSAIRTDLVAPDRETRLRSRARGIVSSNTIALMEAATNMVAIYSIRASLHMSTSCLIQSPITREIQRSWRGGIARDKPPHTQRHDGHGEKLR